MEDFAAPERGPARVQQRAPKNDGDLNNLPFYFILKAFYAKMLQFFRHLNYPTPIGILQGAIIDDNSKGTTKTTTGKIRLPPSYEPSSNPQHILVILSTNWPTILVHTT